MQVQRNKFAFPNLKLSVDVFGVACNSYEQQMSFAFANQSKSPEYQEYRGGPNNVCVQTRGRLWLRISLDLFDGVWWSVKEAEQLVSYSVSSEIVDWERKVQNQSKSIQDLDSLDNE
jgi:hypothetical protein